MIGVFFGGWWMVVGLCKCLCPPTSNHGGAAHPEGNGNKHHLDLQINILFFFINL